MSVMERRQEPSTTITLYKVNEFREKPDLETAKEYVKQGTYFWNSGCFAWMPSTVLDLVNVHMPKLHTILGKIMAEANRSEALDRFYNDCPDISVDYGILEHAPHIYGLKLDAGWNDVGSWPSLFDVIPTDSNGNITSGNELIIKDCHNCLLWSEEQLLGAVGLKDMIVVQSGGAIMVCPKNRGEDVKHIVEQLKKQDLSKYL